MSRNNNQYDLSAIIKGLKKHLDQSRFQHTLGVTYTAAALAMVYDCDLNEVQTAGLLHDCAKCISDRKKIKLCRKNNIKISDYERRNPFMLHPKLGVLIATEEFQVQDPAILNSILWHTTGKPDMTLLEKIIYISDYIEPGRDRAPNLEMIRKTAFRDLDECMFLILKDSLKYLQLSGKEIDTMSISAFEYYRELYNQARRN